MTRAYEDEEARFVEVLASLTKRIPQPVQTIGRPRLPLADMVFACIYMVYLNLATRDVLPKLEALRKRGVIHSSFHRNSICGYMRDARLTPVLEELVRLSTGGLPRIIDPDENELWWSFFEEFVEEHRFRTKDDTSIENESICMSITGNIREFITRRPAHESERSDEQAKVRA